MNELASQFTIHPSQIMPGKELRWKEHPVLLEVDQEHQDKAKKTLIPQLYQQIG